MCFGISFVARSLAPFSFLPGSRHNPLTPCNSIDPTRLDPQEIERVRQAGSSKIVDPNTLAKSLSKIHVQENGGQTCLSATEGDAAHMRNIEERLRSQRFDVFLSFAEEDQDFAEEVRHRIVSKLKLRVFVPSEGESVGLLSLHLSPSFVLQCFFLSADLMPGKVFHHEIADMITKGCRKTIIILSPDYVQSSWCNYEANLVINRSPGTCVT